MAFNEAFNVKVNPENKEATMEVNTNAFTVGGKLEESAQLRIDQITENLNYMQKRLKKPLNSGELKIAWLAIERELEQFKTPQSVDDVMRNSITQISRSEAVDIALSNILTGVEDFVRGRLETVIETVDDEDWVGLVSKSDAGDILKELEKSRDKSQDGPYRLSAQEIQNFKDRFADPLLLEQGFSRVKKESSMRVAADEAMNAK